jgi:hypothetical protein
MADEELESLLNREMDILDIRLKAKSRRTSASVDEYVKTRLLSGTAIDVIEEELLTDLNDGGRIFGEFRNSIRATAHGNMMRIRDASQFSNQGLDVKYQWVAVLINTCDDCLELHGEVKSYSEWEEDGLPRAGHTVCGENCRCVLLPANVVSSPMEPIKRGAK